MADQPIAVDGHPRIITSSLYSALRSLREQEGEIVLWADALCINQEDLVEKMHQVGQMRKIYAEAVQVVVWLGEHEEAGQVVVWLGEHEEAGQVVVWLGEHEEAERIPLLLREQLSRSRVSELPNLDILCSEKCWSHCITNRPCILNTPLALVLQLLERDWWRRIWVIQEVVAASQQPVVRFGTTETQWHEWHRIARHVAFGTSTTFNSDFCDVVARLREGRRLSYDEVRSLVSNMQATEPRDKIFALLGYVDLELPEPMQADYSLPLSTVYCKFTMREICDKSNLDAICVRNTNHELQHSSWALGPHGADRSIFCELQSNNDFGLLLHCAAAKKFKPQARWSSDCTAMFVKGAVVGLVEKSFSEVIDDDLHNRCRSGLKSPVLKNKVLPKNPMREGRVEGNEIKRKSMARFLRFARPIFLFAPENLLREDELGWGPHFYETRTGAFVFGDRGFLSGDKICVLYGGSQAFVLRDHGDHHKLVGCAFVDGMNCRGLDNRLKDGRDITEFEIR
jgi:hypothetical protein